ncbi:MAG: hypothetical protein JWS12_516 [Candidatus Saccharibacteria bacterium]|nr:hypothetical protein [Candidatus Saccharibacteria bacterium]
MKRPITVVMASSLAVCYSVVLVGVAIALMYDYLGSHGHIGSEHLVGTAAQGLKFTVGMLLVGSVLLAAGSYRLLVKRRQVLLIAPLSILFVIGCIGETADALGTASLSSNLIGAGILILIVLPVGLLLTTSGRLWTKQ